jgi:hypothetical protein
MKGSLVIIISFIRKLYSLNFMVQFAAPFPYFESPSKIAIVFY